MSQYPALAVSAFGGRWRRDSRCTVRVPPRALQDRRTDCVALRVGHGGATSLLPMRVLVRCLNPPRRQRPTLIPSECSTHTPQWGRGGKAERLAGGSGAAGGRVRRSESDAPSPTLRVRRSESDAPSPTLRVRRSESDAPSPASGRNAVSGLSGGSPHPASRGAPRALGAAAPTLIGPPAEAARPWAASSAPARMRGGCAPGGGGW